MSKTLKMISVLLMALVLVMTISSSSVYATGEGTTTTGSSTAAGGVLDKLEQKINVSSVDGDGEVGELAGKIISFLQYVAIIGGAIILAALGIKYMMGSVEEKAEYKKSFIPLVVGVIVVMGAITIANVLFNTFTL